MLSIMGYLPYVQLHGNSYTIPKIIKQLLTFTTVQRLCPVLQVSLGALQHAGNNMYTSSLIYLSTKIFTTQMVDLKIVFNDQGTFILTQ